MPALLRPIARDDVAGRQGTVIDIGGQHVRDMQAQRAATVADQHDIAVALDDLLPDWSATHALVGAKFAARQ